MIRTETLTEYIPKRNVPLTKTECDMLRTIAPSISVSPTVGAEGCYDLTAGSWVGAINLGKLAIDVRPKIPISQVLFMLSYSLDTTRWQNLPFDFAEDKSLVEAIIPGFVAQVGRALRRGLLHGYRVEEEASTAVRGRIRFEDQIRFRFGIMPPVEVRYDEFTADVEENRLIKAAIARLGRLQLRSSHARHELRAFDGLLRSVTLVNYDPRNLPTLCYTRLNSHYRPAVELAKLILAASAFEVGHGNVRAAAFLVDMNGVFENFVVLALRDALRLSEREFPQGCRGRDLHLDKAEKVDLQPDISWWEGQRCVFVGDVKYKRVEATGIKHPDLYQLLAYTVAADLPSGLLVYAAGEGEAAIHKVVHMRKELHVVALDLCGTAEVILASVRDVAARIRQLRRDCLQTSYTFSIPKARVAG